MSYFGPKMNPFKMILFVVTHQVDALSMIGFLDSKLTSHKEKTRRKKENKYKKKEKKETKSLKFPKKGKSKVLQGIVL